MDPAVFGYIRVSQAEGASGLATQRRILTDHGLRDDRIFTDVASGRNMLLSLAEWERETIRDRIKAGVDRAAAEGRTGGRPPPLTGVCNGFSGGGVAGDFQVGLGFGPGFGQQPDPAPETAFEQQPPQPVDAAPEYADLPFRLLPAVAMPGRQRLGRRPQVAGGKLWRRRPGPGASPPTAPASGGRRAPGWCAWSCPTSSPGS